jgi:hypothetical protein
VALGNAPLQGGDDLLVVDLPPLQVVLHQLVGVLRDLVHQLLAVLLRLRAQLVGDRYPLGAAALAPLVDEGLHVDQVDDASYLMLGADRDLGRDHVRPEGSLQRVQRGEEVGALAVEHVDEDEPGQALGVGALPESFGLNLDAGDAVDDDHRRVGGPQRRRRVRDEAGVAGRVDQVDLTVVVLEAGDAGIDRKPALLLVGLVIGDRRAVLDLAEPVDRTGLEQHRLVQARLPAAAMTDQRDVANPICSLVRHVSKVHPDASIWCRNAQVTGSGGANG